VTAQVGSDTTLLRKHRRRLGRARGQAVLYAVVLSPVLMLCLTLAVELGALQLEKQRLRSAVDEATTVAAARDASGSAAITLDAARTAGLVRQSLADNLAPLEGHLDGVTADQVAQAADVAVIVEVPAADPFDSTRTLQRPTIEARVRAPVHAGLLGLAGLPSTITFTLVATADLRVVGGAQA
jgi:Flp pilus assembly protein TadG